MLINPSSASYNRSINETGLGRELEGIGFSSRLVPILVVPFFTAFLHHYTNFERKTDCKQSITTGIQIAYNLRDSKNKLNVPLPRKQKPKMASALVGYNISSILKVIARNI